MDTEFTICNISIPIELISFILWTIYKYSNKSVLCMVSDDYTITDAKTISNLLSVCKLWNSILTDVNTIPQNIGLISDPGLAIIITKTSASRLTVINSFPKSFHPDKNTETKKFTIADIGEYDKTGNIIDLHRWLEIYSPSDYYTDKWNNMNHPGKHGMNNRTLINRYMFDPHFSPITNISKYKRAVRLCIDRIKKDPQSINDQIIYILAGIMDSYTPVFIDRKPNYSHIDWMLNKLDKYMNKDLLCEYFNQYLIFISNLINSGYPSVKIVSLVQKWNTYPLGSYIDLSEFDMRYKVLVYTTHNSILNYQTNVKVY